MKVKRGESSIGMSFGVLFSIFLIVVFVVFAFIAINFFLDFSRVSSVNMFYDNLQGEVNKIWTASSAERDFEVNLPGGIDYVCFVDFSRSALNDFEKYDEVLHYNFTGENLFLFPQDEFPAYNKKLIENININETTVDENPFCVENSGKLKLVKELYGGRDVIVRRG